MNSWWHHIKADDKKFHVELGSVKTFNCKNVLKPQFWAREKVYQYFFKDKIASVRHTHNIRKWTVLTKMTQSPVLILNERNFRQKSFKTFAISAANFLMFVDKKFHGNYWHYQLQLSAFFSSSLIRNWSNEISVKKLLRRFEFSRRVLIRKRKERKWRTNNRVCS